ncbi:MAG: ORF6N domain-containing protein [Bacteroidota bacterium]
MSLSQTARIESLILIIRGERVILDADLAKIYSVTTKRLNEQVKRNIEKFPADFAFQLTKTEFANLKSQNATSSFIVRGSDISLSGRKLRPLRFSKWH